MQTISVKNSGSVGDAMGGFGHDWKVARTHAEAFAYDFAQDTWSEAPSRLPEPMTQFDTQEYEHRGRCRLSKTASVLL